MKNKKNILKTLHVILIVISFFNVIFSQEIPFDSQSLTEKELLIILNNFNRTFYKLLYLYYTVYFSKRLQYAAIHCFTLLILVLHYNYANTKFIYNGYESQTK